MNNYMSLKFKSIPENEIMARSAVASFVNYLNPDMNELADIKTSISEAVTNCIIHGYEGKEGDIELTAITEGGLLTVKIVDFGKGIDDIEKAKEPLYTSKPELERSGMGFTIMESFMDTMQVISSDGKGTMVIMTKNICGESTYYATEER